jgi:hypothetical protein
MTTIEENQALLAEQILNGQPIGNTFAENEAIRKIANEHHALLSIKDSSKAEMYQNQREQLDNSVNAMAKSLNTSFINKKSNDSIFEYMKFEDGLKEQMSSVEVSTWNLLKNEHGYTATRQALEQSEGNVFLAMAKLKGFNSFSEFQKSQSEFKNQIEADRIKREADEHQIDLMARAYRKALNNK